MKTSAVEFNVVLLRRDLSQMDKYHIICAQAKAERAKYLQSLVKGFVNRFKMLLLSKKVTSESGANSFSELKTYS